MRVYRRKKSSRWQADLWLEVAGVLHRFRRSLGPEVTSKRQAERAAERLLADLRVELERARVDVTAATPTTPPPGAMEPASGSTLPPAAFDGYAYHWLATAVKPSLKPSVYRRYKSIIDVHLIPYFKARLIETFTRHDIEVWRARQLETKHPDTGRPLARKTVNNNFAVLSSMFTKAVEWGYLARNPCSGIELLSLPPQGFAFYDGIQTDAFLSKAAEIEPAWYPLFLFAFRTGLRLGELLALQWGDLDLVHGRVHVQRSITRGEITLPKNGKARLVDLTPKLVSVLKAHRHLRSELVFCREDGTHLTRDVFKHPWERTMRASGLPRIRIHDARHSFASQLVMNGVPLLAVKELLGHSDIKQTLRYAHLAPRATAAYVGTLDHPSPAPSESVAHSRHTANSANEKGRKNR